MEVHPFNPQPKLLDTLILMSLRDQSRHGYEIESIVANIASDRFHPASGSIYKALNRLCREKYISPSDVDGLRKYYEITSDGLARLSWDISFLNRLARAYDYR